MPLKNMTSLLSFNTRCIAGINGSSIISAAPILILFFFSVDDTMSIRSRNTLNRCDLKHHSLWSQNVEIRDKTYFLGKYNTLL